MSTPLQSIQNESLAGRAPPSPPPSPLLTRHDENRAPEPSPATVERPAKRRKVDVDSINNKTDEEVWNFEDSEIIDGLRSKWKSDAYNHFTPSLVRDLSTTPRTIKIVLTCKFGDPKHNSFERLRSATGTFNTSNMLSSVKTCVSRDPSRASSIIVQSAPPGALEYSEDHARAFNQVEDKWYRLEVEMLRPGTVVPSADTVAEDVQRLYVLLARDVKKYFAQRNRELHNLVDGWTAPIEDQYLGAVIVWEDAGKIFEIVLEFIPLTDRHTGEYLASELAEVLNKYGLAAFLHFLMMDNAGNCNTTATCLVRHIPTFRGMLARGRCFTHIIQLVAKAVISFFFKQAKRKKTVKAKTGSVKRSTAVTAPIESDDVEEVILWEDDPSADAEDLALVAEIHEPEDDTAPTGQDLHDAKVTNTIRDVAIRDMRAGGIVISAVEEKDALKVAGLAKKVHESRPIHTEFMAIIENPATGLSKDSNVTELARRNATRWGSEYNCLRTRHILEPAVDALLADKNLKLGSYKFTARQKTLAVELETILEVLDGPTKLFQSQNRPLIVDVIPEMEDLDYMLRSINESSDLSNVTRVAAYAGLLVLRKYYALLDDCEAYRIAIVMCPDRKLQWFRERGWKDDQISEIRSLVIRRFTESYKTSASATPAATSPSDTISTSSTSKKSRLSDRFRRPTVSFDNTTSESDNIHTYLDAPSTEPTSGVIEYWNSRLVLTSTNPSIPATPDLARFGLSFCSCPEAQLSFDSCIR
ncbi:putative AC transposase [Favolaschia claudopus]|uniref:AC transposase n=1 Tax=Favolaschia claudopus TaxID=2862362 RepID=A0AAW0B989_9AGAR